MSVHHRHQRGADRGGHGRAETAATGLGINPPFPAGKLAWVTRHVPDAAGLLAQGRLRAGTIGGVTSATQPAPIARATFEAIALQIADGFAAMERDIGQPLAGLLADGGGSANGFLMQLQADLLDRPVTRSDMTEVGAMGATAMAFHGLGIEARGLEGECGAGSGQKWQVLPGRMSDPAGSALAQVLHAT